LQKDGKKVLTRVGVCDILSKLSAGHGDAALKKLKNLKKALDK